MKKLFLFAWIVLFVFSCCAYGQENSLVAGEQVLQSIELTQSNQKWNLSHREKDLVAQQPIAESQTETLNYWVFMPRNETAKTEQGYPLILFLHGMGERGAKPELVKKNGLPKLLTQKPFQNQCPFIVVSPQCPDGKCWSGKQLVELVEKLLVKYPVDKSRVYITGLSMGGFGTWAAMAERPDLFAAGIPVCGGGDIKNAEKQPLHR